MKDLQALKKGSTMETLEILQKQLPNLQAATDRVKILQKENANFAQTKQTYRHTHTA